MKKHKKHFFVDVMVYSLPTFLSRGMAFFLLPIYTRYLTPTDYGVLEMVTTLYVILNLVLPLEINQAAARFLPEEESNEGKSKLASTTFWFTFAVFAFFFGLAIIIPQVLSTLLFQSASYENVIRLAGLSMMANALLYVVQSQLRFGLKAKQSASVAMTFSLVTGGVAVTTLVFLDMGLYSMLIGQFIGSSIGVALGIYHLRSSAKIAFNFDLSLWKKMIHFSAPLVLSSIGVYLGSFIDRWMLSQWTTLEEVGIYSVAFRFASVSNLAITGISMALMPLIYNHYKDAETPEKIDQILRLLLTTLLCGIIFVGLFAEPVVLLLTTEAYISSAPLIVWLTIAVVLSSLYIFAPGTAIMKKTKTIAKINLIAAGLNIVFNAFLIPKYGVEGATISRLVTGVVMVGLYIWHGQKLYPIPYRYFRMVLSAIIMLVTIAFVPYIGLVWQLQIAAWLLASVIIGFVLLEGREFKNIRF